MSIILKNRSLIPGFMNQLLGTGSMFRPEVFNFDGELFDFKTTAVVPEVNIAETDSAYQIELAAPGLKKEDFKVSVEDQVLTISSEKEEKKTEENKNYRTREFSYSSFRRSFSLPENSLPEKMDARYENGILNISLPKKVTGPVKVQKQIKVS